MDNFKQRLEKLVTSMVGKDRIESFQTDELFLLHNYYYPNQRETGKSCPPCRGRVLNKMRALWATLKDA
jgi:hypothetical protein